MITDNRQWLCATKFEALYIPLDACSSVVQHPTGAQKGAINQWCTAQAVSQQFLYYVIAVTAIYD